MAVFEALNLFTLLVENVFGSIWLAGLGITILFIVMGMMSKMSAPTIIVVVGTFIGVFAVGYVGAIAAVPLFIIGLIYFAYGWINYFTNSATN